MPKKKRLTQKEFERKIQVWTIVITLIVSVIGSLTAITLAYLNRPNTEYIMAHDDQLEVNKLSAQISLLSARYFAAQDQTEKERLNAELDMIAKTEAAIMRKYNPNYQPRWPLVSRTFHSGRYLPLLISLALIMSVGISAHYALARIWKKRYRKQLLDGYIIEAVRRSSWERSTNEIIHYVRGAHPDYKPEDIEDALSVLEAEREIEIHNGRWSLIAENGFI